MNNVQDHLLAHEQAVGHEFACTDGHSGCVNLQVFSWTGKFFTIVDSPLTKGEADPGRSGYYIPSLPRYYEEYPQDCANS
jgi:hypothetical protein